MEAGQNFVFCDCSQMLLTYSTESYDNKNNANNDYDDNNYYNKSISCKNTLKDS